MAVKARIRFDFKVEPRTRRFFWQPRDIKETARKLRASQASLFRNLPFQGLNVESLDVDHEVYLVEDNESNREVAYAPLEMVVEADSIGDLMPLTLREEFRKIKLLEPQEILLNHSDVERFLFQISAEYRQELN